MILQQKVVDMITQGKPRNKSIAINFLTKYKTKENKIQQ